MSHTIPLVSAVIIAGLAGVVYTTQRSSDSNDGALSDSASRVQIAEGADDSELTQQAPAADLLKETTLVAPDTNLLSDNELLQDNASNDENTLAASGASVSQAIDFARSIAHSGMDNATIIAHAKALSEDPALLSAVLDEFAAETDVKRLSRLRLLLGQLDDESMVGVAESMVFSGNPASADAGLDLLRDIGDRVPGARNIALDVMSSTQDPELLLGAANVMAVAGSNDPEVTQRVVSTLSSHVQHPDARVRRASFSTLARWSKDPSVTPTLLQGLNDVDPAVRKSTAYGFVGYPHADASVIEALLQTAENNSDTRRARRGAVLALSGMSLDDSQRARLQSVQAQIN